MEMKETMTYIVIAIVIVAVVAIVIGASGVLSRSYSVSLTLAPQGPPAAYPYQTSHFYINVTNKGNNNIKNMLVGFYLNGVPLSTQNVSIPAGQSVSIPKNYSYLQAGNYTFQAVADPGHIQSIPNRSSTQGTLTYRILEPQPVDVYASVPNNNIISTQSFTVTGEGAYGGAQMAQEYNLSMFGQLFSQPNNVTAKVYEDLASYIAYANGAYVQYANNSVAYVAWLQGTVNPAALKLVISSFGAGAKQAGNVTYSTITNSVSACYWYGQGWTRLIAYNNRSAPGATCLSFAGKTYNSTESAMFVRLLKNSTNLTKNQAGFVYTNITPLGSVVGYKRGNLTTTNIFTDQYGFIFSSSIKKLYAPFNSSRLSNPNNTCYGLIYNNGSVHVCSMFVPPRNYSTSTPFAMINSSEITPKYVLNIYSFVNSTLLTTAHDNAARLINAQLLNRNGTASAVWYSGFRNACSLNNQSLGCGLASFDYSNNTASINIDNRFSTPITITKANCELASGFPNSTMARTIPANGTARISLECYNLPVPDTAPVLSYTFFVNYTRANAPYYAQGYLNVTSEQLNSSG